MIERTFSHYRILSKLGGGGMGVVYEAEDTRLGRRVAVKFLPEELVGNQEALDRFEREARAASLLNHPYICTVHDFGVEEGKPFLVMELMKGASLKAVLEGRPLPMERVIDLGAQIADALEAAHAQGIVHRDIKPANIFVTDRGEAKILDFGLAKLATGKDSATCAEPPADRTLSFRSDLTTPGTTMGTVMYMSPEQARGRDVDARSDLFSFAIVLYEMATGALPFRGGNPIEICDAILNGTPVPPVRINPEVPLDLERILAKALEKDPSLRYQSAAEMKTDLRRLSRGAGPPAAVVEHPSRRRWPVAAAALALAVLAVAGGLWLSRRSGQAKTAGPKRIAVLPFENQGSPEDAYFADGVTDEVRSKLTALPGLAVIARSSVSPYKGSSKTAQEIASELRVGYILTGTVRWQKNAAGASRIRVVPELVEVAGSGPATTRWQDSFDAVLEDVFKVQGEIAGQVAGALKVALEAGEKETLSERPTASIAAYDAFLRGQETSNDLEVNDGGTLRRAANLYEQAVALDPSFALAWAQLSRARTLAFFNSTPLPALGEAARQAAEKALELAPRLPEAHLALGLYYGGVRKDPQRALEEYGKGLAFSPNHTKLVVAASLAEMNLGRWPEALAHLEQARSLDSRSPGAANRLGIAFAYLRRYPEALEAFDQALALAPGNVSFVIRKAMTHLARGDLASARAVVAEAGRHVEPAVLVSTLAMFYDLVWVLDEAQTNLLERMTPTMFGDNRGAWAIALAQSYALRGDKDQALRLAGEAERDFGRQVGESPDDSQMYVLHGLALAYLGRKDEAIREGERGVALEPLERSALDGVYLQHVLARIYILVGEPEKALGRLEPLLSMPSYLSPGFLAIDPGFAPLKGNVRFEKLLRGQGAAGPKT